MEKFEKEKTVELTRVMNILGVRKYTESNLDLMNLVAASLDRIPSKQPVITRTEYSKEQLIYTGLETLKIYDKKVVEKIEGIFSTTGFVIVTKPCEFTTRIDFDVNNENEKYVVDKKSGKVNHFKISKISSLSDIIWYAHEGLHACKDTYYDEYIDLCRYDDVITLLHELILSLDLNEELFNEWIKIRYYFIKSNIDKVKAAQKEKQEDINNQEIYDTVIGLAGECLTSYYYALILFDLYLTNPRAVLGQVNKVLNGEQTTEEMLNFFKILNPKNDLNNKFINMSNKFTNYLRR